MVRTLAAAAKWLIGAIVLASVAFCVWWWHRHQMVSPEQYHVRGKFGPVLSWPLIPIQVLTLPDGRVMSYGTDAQGRQSGLTIYDVWDPLKGVGPSSHLTLPNQTGTDVFCSGQLIVPSDQAVLLVGGDRTVNGQRNWSSPDINFFDFKKNALKSAGRTMERPRWYPTVATLPNGEVLVAGGRLDPTHFAPMPEIYSPERGWRTLPGAEVDDAYGSPNWNYPRLWPAPNGMVFNVSRTGETFYLDTQGAGRILKLHSKLWRSHSYLPSLMYAPGRVLSLRLLGRSNDIDLNQPGLEPTIKNTDWHVPVRVNASATVMADGQVFMSGGGLKNNDSGSAILANRLAEIWNPQTGHWSPAAVAQVERLYHSVSLLMPDASVLTGAGGAGYVKAQNNLNVEFYYPPYLFKQDGSGELAARPVLETAPVWIHWGEDFDIRFSGGEVARVSLIQMGSATHAQVYEQRFMALTVHREADGHWTVKAPADENTAPPGYYYLFAFNEAGVPSVAKIVRLGG